MLYISFNQVDVKPVVDDTMLSYKVYGPWATNFQMSTSQVHLAGPLDRDYPVGYSDWQLNVQVSYDGSSVDDLSSYAMVSLQLIDINDNAPVFDTGHLEGSVPEQTSSQYYTPYLFYMFYEDCLYGYFMCRLFYL